jgi:hypothetical protein
MSKFNFERTYTTGSDDAVPKQISPEQSDQIDSAVNKPRIFTLEELFADAQFCNILSESARKVREALPAVRPNNPDEGNSEILIY